MEFPDIEELYHVDDQFLVGSDLLVKPVTEPGATESLVLFPNSDDWYDVDTMTMIETSKNEGKFSVIKVDSDIDKIPVYQRGGSVIPRKLRLRRSSEMMIHDPYTLYIALNNTGSAKGSIYMDDEKTYEYEHDQKAFFAEANFEVEIEHFIRCIVSGNGEWLAAQPGSSRRIERIVIMGVKVSPKIIMWDSKAIQFQYNEENRILVLKTDLSALHSWELSLLS